MEQVSRNEKVSWWQAFFNYFSAAIDKSGREIWNSGDNSFVWAIGSVFILIVAVIALLVVVMASFTS